MFHQIAHTEARVGIVPAISVISEHIQTFGLKQKTNSSASQNILSDLIL